jgi:hypothetical protein
MHVSSSRTACTCTADASHEHMHRSVHNALTSCCQAMLARAHFSLVHMHGHTTHFVIRAHVSHVCLTQCHRCGAPHTTRCSRCTGPMSSWTSRVSDTCVSECMSVCVSECACVWCVCGFFVVRASSVCARAHGHKG